jgi:predicted enzyme related to lactoylglutathione lyase
MPASRPHHAAQCNPFRLKRSTPFRSTALAAIAAFTALAVPPPPAPADPPPQTPIVGVGPQYDSSHIYVAPADLDHFVASFLATFGGTSSPAATMTVTPTPSETVFRVVSTPAGLLSTFAFKSPIPYPFGAERTGYLVTNMDDAIRAARASGADIVVEPFNDPIGRDAVIQWPGGVYMQLYWHTSPPHNPPLAALPENRIYLSTDKASEFIKDFLNFSHGTITSDNAKAPGIEIGSPTEIYRRVRIESIFGKMTLLFTAGHLPYPYGRETTGYEVADLATTLEKAKASGAAILVAPYATETRTAAIVQFPGGYIAEIHSPLHK